MKKQTTSLRKLRIESLEERALMAVVSGTESHVAAVAAPMATSGEGGTVVTTLQDVERTDGKVSLREAINNAKAGDTITFASNLAGGTITLKYGTLFIKKGITIKAPENGGITLTGNDTVFNITGGTSSKSSVTLESITIVNSYRGIYNHSILNVSHCNISNCKENGIWNDGGRLTVNNNSKIINNQKTGISCVSGIMTVLDSEISGNKGGGISCTYSTSTITHCDISNNREPGGTTKGGGGGVYIDGGNSTITDCTIIGNWANGNGGGVKTGYGSTLIIKQTTIANNTATTTGGGLINDSGCNMTLINCTVKGNKAVSGGGIHNNSGNIAAESAMKVYNCLISGNKASKYGGGFYLPNLSETEITNSTIVGNTAQGGMGGGIYLGGYSSTILKIRNSIIVQNNSSNSSAADIGKETQFSKIYAYNTISSFTAWTTKSNTYNYSASVLFTNPSNEDYTLKAGSPAINKGKDSYISGYSEDLAGNARKVGGTVDIGAYEYQGAPVKPDLTYYLQGSVTPVTNGKFTLKNIAVRNNGNAAANGYTVTVYASEDSTINASDKVLATYRFTSTLAAGIATPSMNKEISVSSLTEGKTYYIGWIVTTNNDSNPSNNTAKSGTITVPAAKTTDIAYEKIGTLSAVANGKFSITGATVKNAGNTNIKGGYAVFVFASPDITVNGAGNDIHLMTITSTPALNAGTSAPLQLDNIPTNTLTAGKTYYIGWIVDRVNGEKDTQLANNFATCTKQITIPAASPNLKANNGGSVTASSKGKFNLKLGAIENLGGKQAASGWKVTVYACTDTKFAASNTINLGTYTMSYAIGAGKTRSDITVKNVNSSKLKSGTSYYFKWVISNVKDEVKADQGNNTARTTKKFKVTNGIVASNALLPATANSKSATDSIFADYTDDLAVDFGLF